MAISETAAFLLLPAAYLLGSISFAYLAGRLKGIDLRQHGSCNLGATNAGRVLGGQWFALVFTLDVLKGLAPVLAAHLLATAAELTPGQRTWLLLGTATAAILGHVYTCFHGFKGGKAVATSLGALVALVPWVALAAFGAWLVAWLICWLGFRLGKAGSVAPASVVAAIATPVAHLRMTPQPWSAADLPLTVFLLLLATLVVVKHRSNLHKLFSTKAAT